MPRSLLGLAALLLLAAPVPARAAGCGDLTGDGATNIADVVAALRLSVRLDEPTPAAVAEADVAPVASLDDTTVPPTATPRPNGVLDVGDVVQLLRFSVGLVALPACPPEAAQVPRLVHAAPVEACEGGAITITVTNPGRLPVGPVRFSAGEAMVVAEREIPGGLERVVALGGTATPSPGTLTVDGALGALAVRAARCAGAPVVVDAWPARVAPLREALVQVVGDDLACATSVTLAGSDGSTVDAPVVRHAGQQALFVRVPGRAWPEGTQLDVVVASECGTSPGPRPSLLVTSAAGPLADATAIRFEDTGLPIGAAEAGVVVIEGASLDLVDAVRLGDREMLAAAACALDAGSLRCTVEPPAGAWSSLTESVTVRSAGGWDPTPLELSWVGRPAPRCGDVSPSVVASGVPALLDIVGEHLQGVSSVHVGGSASAAWLASSDGRRLQVAMDPEPPGELSVRLDAPAPWAATCPVTLSVR